MNEPNKIAKGVLKDNIPALIFTPPLLINKYARPQEVAADWGGGAFVLKTTENSIINYCL